MSSNSQTWALITLFFFLQTVSILNRSGPFICDKCGSKHWSRKAIHFHNYKHYREATWFCDLCPRSFILKRILIEHIEKDHLKLRPFRCKDCEYKSFHKISLENHMKQHDSKSECKVCHKFVKNMQKHLQGHVKVKCRICSKIVSKPKISVHHKIHKKWKYIIIKQ